jgi:hypothetical protein
MHLSVVASLLLSFTCSLAAVSAAHLHHRSWQSDQTADSVRAIRQHFTTINKGTRRYKKIKKELAGFSTEGGELIAYLDNQAIVKIVATYFGETGRTLEEYYYWNGELIFVLRKEMTYDQPLSGKVVRSEANRFYFEKRKLIRFIDQDGKQVHSADPDFSKQQQDCLDTSELFLKGTRAKAPTIDLEVLVLGL